MEPGDKPEAQRAESVNGEVAARDRDKDACDSMLDDIIEESFPSSDPPPWPATLAPSRPDVTK
jgi:hypothetical protein